MKNFTLFLGLLALTIHVYSQKDDYTWIIGDMPVKMDFTTTGFTFDSGFHQNNGVYFSITSFTQNDSAGNLLYYTNGAYVYNRLGDVMDNGDNLNPSTYLAQLINNGDGIGNSFLQGAMGVKKPGSDSLYYLFHFGVNNNCPGYPIGAGFG